MLFTAYTPTLIERVGCPIHIAVGSLDKVAPKDKHADRLQVAARAMCEVHVLEGYGHILKLEAPSQFNAIVRQAARDSMRVTR